MKLEVLSEKQIIEAEDRELCLRRVAKSRHEHTSVMAPHLTSNLWSKLNAMCLSAPPSDFYLQQATSFVIFLYNHLVFISSIVDFTLMRPYLPYCGIRFAVLYDILTPQLIRSTVPRSLVPRSLLEHGLHPNLHPLTTNLLNAERLVFNCLNLTTWSVFTFDISGQISPLLTKLRCFISYSFSIIHSGFIHSHFIYFIYRVYE